MAAWLLLALMVWYVWSRWRAFWREQEREQDRARLKDACEMGPHMPERIWQSRYQPDGYRLWRNRHLRPRFDRRRRASRERFV